MKGGTGPCHGPKLVTLDLIEVKPCTLEFHSTVHAYGLIYIYIKRDTVHPNWSGNWGFILLANAFSTGPLFSLPFWLPFNHPKRSLILELRVWEPYLPNCGTFPGGLSGSHRCHGGYGSEPGELHDACTEKDCIFMN